MGEGVGTTGRIRVGPVMVAVAALLLVTGCGTDEEPAPEQTTAAEQATEPAAEPTTPAAPATTITAVDYEYPDAPETLEAGTRVTLQNDSSGEVHEILALRVPDGEDRSARELLSLPPEQLMQVVEIRGVTLAGPGDSSADSPAPPLVLEQPGRYIFACLIPTGAPPQEVLQAAQEFAASGATEGGPAYPETGPPHAANGMFTEVTVTG